MINPFAIYPSECGSGHRSSPLAVSIEKNVENLELSWMTCFWNTWCGAMWLIRWH